MQQLKGQKGFTLIEAVVAAGVFAFVVSSSLGVYMAVMKLDTKSRAERSVLQNTRFIMEYLAKEVRNGSIDYNRPNDADTLSLINQLNEEITLQWDEQTQTVTLEKNGIIPTTLNSDDVRVTNMEFFLHPDDNPFILANNLHIQPHVTVVLEIISTNTGLTDGARINVQSTFSVREYPVRE